MIMNNAIAVAGHIVAYASDLNKPNLTPLRLLKLTYLCHGWHLGYFGRAIFSDHVCAWKLGPIIPNLYQFLKSHRDRPIFPKHMPPINTHVPDSSRELIRSVFDAFGDWCGIKLSKYTACFESPWDTARKINNTNVIISNDLIEHYYKRQINQLRSSCESSSIF